MPKEDALCIDRESLPALFFLEGYTAIYAADEPLSDAAYSWQPRPDCETQEEYLQVIPYTLCYHDNPTHGLEVLILERLVAGSEKRLHGKLSLGIGGHINPVDAMHLDGKLDFSDTLCAATVREYNEELRSNYIEPPFTTVGMVYSNANPVDRVHLGIVNVVEIDNLDRTLADNIVRETSKLQGDFIPIGRLFDIYERLEPWSQYLAQALLARELPL